MQYYYGDGKGKSTAAIGSAIRMAGSGGKVVMCQFFKNGDSSEVEVLKKIPEIIYVNTNTDYKMILSEMTNEDKENLKILIKEYIKTLRQISQMSEKEDVKMVVLDEFDYLYKSGNETHEMGKEIKKIILNINKNCELILTGHDGMKELINIASYVTKFEKIKHPYDQGQEARKGIEY